MEGLLFYIAGTVAKKEAKTYEGEMSYSALVQWMGGERRFYFDSETEYHGFPPQGAKVQLFAEAYAAKGDPKAMKCGKVVKVMSGAAGGDASAGPAQMRRAA